MWGFPQLKAWRIILTGNLGYVLGPVLCRLFRLKDPLSKGTAYGTAAHVIGTSRALQDDPLSGAAGSLSLTVAGRAGGLALHHAEEALACTDYVTLSVACWAGLASAVSLGA